MSATASVPNPAAAASPAGPASAKTAGTASAKATGALGAFDAVMAAFFASIDGTAQTGDPASMAATPAAGATVTDGGKAPVTGEDPAPAPAEGETPTSDAGTPGADLMLALLGLGAQPPPLAPVPPAAAGGEAATGGGQAGPRAGQAPPTFMPPEPQAEATAAALLTAEATPSSDTPAGAAETEMEAPAATTGADKAQGAASAPGERRATPTPPGLAQMAPSALQHARVAQATESAPAAPAPDSSDHAPAAAATEAAGAVIQEAVASTKAAKSAEKGDKPAEKAPRAARADATAPVAAARIGGASATGAASGASAAETAADKSTTEQAAGEATTAQAPAEAEAALLDASPTGQASAQATLQTRETLAHAPAATQVRGSPETVASLSAHLIKKLDERASRFDLQLDPVGLGRVDVRLEINRHGQVTAAMSFDNPQAAAELKARSAELQHALEQAGFDISGGMSFDVADQSNGGAQQQREFDSEAGAAFRGRAFQAALDTAGEAASAATASALYYRQAPAAGVDVRI